MKREAIDDVALTILEYECNIVSLFDKMNEIPYSHFTSGFRDVMFGRLRLSYLDL